MILVTGGAGFIGSNLVAALDARGERVVVSDWLGQGDKWRNLAKRDLEMIIAPEQLHDFLSPRGGDIQAVFHMGAISTTTETDIDQIVENNLRLSQALWGWCAIRNVPFIYASSAATYGDGSNGFVDDDNIDALAKLRPLNAYGWSKHLFDRWVARQKAARVKAPPQCVGLKFFNVYGPNEYHKDGQRSVAEQIHPVAARGEAFPLFKSYNPAYIDGGQQRDFVWVGDCVDVMMWFLDHPKISGLFNLGTGQARSFVDLAKAVYQAVDRPPQILFREMPEELRNKYQYFTEADMTKLKRAGYTKPFTSVEDGVKLYVQKYLSAPDQYI
jgi:ADP-L-glycero-D-manno-heptose 6-epimerase